MPPIIEIHEVGKTDIKIGNTKSLPASNMAVIRVQ